MSNPIFKMKWYVQLKYALSTLIMWGSRNVLPDFTLQEEQKEPFSNYF
jgi:hypothetical protein